MDGLISATEKIMGLELFNTLSRTVEPFQTLDQEGKKVGMYCCGPTVHDYAHIGNFRTFVLSDLMRRYLDFKGYDVRHVMNITDVEDKIIARVKASGGSLRDYTSRYEKAFLNDLSDLQCQLPTEMPRATEHMPSIIDLIKRLVERGIAYSAKDGSVYFSINHYQKIGCCYGQLLKLDFDQMRPGERVQSDEYAKDSVADFALWKARTEGDGDVFWESPWGEGRPGWHVECSAMSMQYLGASFDLHLGGEDLVFPHHEDEIAQSEGAAMQEPGQKFVKHWVHGSHLLVEGKKMSKSLGNFFTLRDLIGKGFTGREIRFVLLSAHYRETFNFTMEGLQGAKTALSRLDECLYKLNQKAGDSKGDGKSDLPLRFEKAMDDDLNVSAAWAVVFEWVRDMNRQIAEGSLNVNDASVALQAWGRIDSVLGIGSEGKADDIPAEVQSLAEQRLSARQSKDYTAADRIRDELKAMGWVVEDTPQGPRPKKI
jgi:cysteinyl-tRNA synthetase